MTVADLINRMIECLKALGSWSPNDAKFDELLSKPVYYRPNNGAFTEVPTEVLQKVKKAILSGNVSDLDPETHKIAGRAGSGTQSYEFLSNNCKYSFEYDDILAAFGIDNSYTIRKMMLEYYKQDKAARDASKIKEELSRFNKGEYAESLLRSFLHGFRDFKGNFVLAKADDEAKPSDSQDGEGKVTENTKVTLTLGQLRKLVKESEGTEKQELEIVSIDKFSRGMPTKDGTKKMYVIKFALDGDKNTQEAKVWALTEDEAVQKLLDEYNAVRTDVPMFEDGGDGEEPVLWWEVVSKETGARFASGTVPENEKAEKFKSVLEFLYGDDVEVRIKRIF